MQRSKTTAAIASSNGESNQYVRYLARFFSFEVLDISCNSTDQEMKTMYCRMPLKYAMIPLSQNKFVFSEFTVLMLFEVVVPLDSGQWKWNGLTLVFECVKDSTIVSAVIYWVKFFEY
ncbi:hypothetical protein E2542_SST25161 [Spatholobus suberectus]|nr:hypothetical protein E2542_SST25161 [Spatholobus suberectus]